MGDRTVYLGPVGSAKAENILREHRLDELAIVAAEFQRADAELVQAVLAALAEGVSAAEVARVAGLPYRKVLKWRDHA